MDTLAPNPAVASAAPVRASARLPWLPLALGVVVFVVALTANLSRLPDTRFHPDESRWINRADYIAQLVHPTSAFWEERYLTRGQPPVGSYVTGLGLLLQGRDLDTNGPWDFRFGNEDAISWNVAYGNMPSWADLEAARRTSAALGALTAVLLFAAVTMLTNAAGGLVAGLFFAFHPLSLYLSTIATSDALFTMLIALAVLVAILLAKSPSWPRAIALGVILGLGAGTKLSPLVIAPGMGAFGIVLLAIVWARRVPSLGRLAERLPGAGSTHLPRLGIMLISVPLTTVTTFLLTYPYLWPDPLGRTANLFSFRRAEMANQARIWPQAAIDSRTEALDRLWRNLELTYSTTGYVWQEVARWFDRSAGPAGIDLPLAAIGLGLFAVIAVRRGIGSAAMVGGVLLAGQSFVLLAGIRVDFNRYYLPLVLLASFGVGVLVGQLWAWIAPRARAAVTGKRSTTAQPA